MTCVRCGKDHEELTDEDAPLYLRAVIGRAPWCKPCELQFDAWSRRYASDVVWEVFAGGVIVLFAAMGLPLLGLNWLAAASGIFAGAGTVIWLHRFNRRRRRHQYLQSGDVPRAYLPSKSSG